MISNGLFYVPAALSSFLEGNFKLKMKNGSFIGKLATGKTTCWGLSPFFRRRGGEPGDYLILLFDLSNREANIQIGDISLVDSFQNDEGFS